MLGICDRAKSEHPEVAGYVLLGDPIKEIPRKCEELNVTLLVLGSRGRSAMARLLLGSVSHYILYHAMVSIVIVQVDKK